MFIDRARWQDLLSVIHAEVKVLHAMDARLDRMEVVLARLDERTRSMSNEMDALRAAVERIDSTEKSVVVLINGIAQLIRDNAANPAVLQLLADQLNRDADGFNAAVAANTDVVSGASPSTQPLPGSGASALNPSIPSPTPSNPTPATTPNSGVRPPAQDPQRPSVPLGPSQVAPPEGGTDPSAAPPPSEPPPGPVAIPPPDGA